MHRICFNICDISHHFPGSCVFYSSDNPDLTDRQSEKPTLMADSQH